MKPSDSSIKGVTRNDKPLVANRISPLTSTGSVNRRIRVISTTPYSVFVRTSPVYITSKLRPKRPGRPSSRTCWKCRRSLPYRPDAYPYADARWSYLKNRKQNTEDQ